jgi:hypothetical protein
VLQSDEPQPQTQQLLPVACSKNTLPLLPSLSDPLPSIQRFVTEGWAGTGWEPPQLRIFSSYSVSYQPHFRTSLSLSLSLPKVWNVKSQAALLLRLLPCLEICEAGS